MNRPKVTFLMTAYNAEKYIAKAIESVQQQTEQEVVLFIRNNGSNDSTGDIIRRYAEVDGRIRFVENKHNNITDEGIGPYGKGWWPCPEDVLGDYISVLDADDWLAPEFVAEMYKSAVGADTDMVIGGCHFVDEETGGFLGMRTPPSIDTMIDMGNVGTRFPELYPSLRTWWGKLYKRDFFLQHYTECWTPVEPLEWVIDTIVVLRYLGKSRRMVTIDRPLYYFLQRHNSTYSAKPLDCVRNWEADLCYRTGMNLLDQWGIQTQENMFCLLNIHWGYLIESMRGLRENKMVAMMPAKEKMTRLAYVWNDEILATYLTGNYDAIYQTSKSYISDAIAQDQNQGAIWSSYLARLYYFENGLKTSLNGTITLPVLLSCLCDHENHNHAGRHYFNVESQYWWLNEPSKGVEQFLLLNEGFKEYCYTHPQTTVDLINEQDRTPIIIAQEEELIAAFQQEDFERACDLIEEIGKVCPFSMVAMYCRIYIAAMIGESELANVLASAAKVLWPNERDIQLLYWDITHPVHS